jgi:signal transduction histidine kinase
MAAGRWTRISFGVLFALYATGLLIWLTLGLLPTLSAILPSVRHVLEPVAMRGGALGTAVSRITSADMSMSAMSMSTAGVLVQYGFSALNFGLGLMLAIRRPDEPVPRLLAFALLGTAATFNMPSHRAFYITGSPWPIAAIHFTFHIVSGVSYLWAVLLFADGTLPSRVRVSARGQRVAAVAVTLAATFICWRSSFLAHPQFFVIFFGILIPVVGIGAQALRLADPATDTAHRRAARLLTAALLPALGVAVTWLAARGVQWVGGAPGVASGWLAVNLQDLFPAVFAIVPVVLFAGIVRHRLWGIDRVLSRVLVYGAIAAVVSAAYVVAVAFGGWHAGGALWFSVLVLSVMAVAIEPIRSRARRWSNRIVFGQDLSPSEAIRTLISGLEHLSPTAELDQLVEVTVRATRAQRAELWLVDGDDLVCAASTNGEGERRAGPYQHSADALQAALGASKVWPVVYQHQLLGVLAVWAASDVSLTAADESLLAEVAAHARVLVNNALLTVRLARQVQKLSVHAEQLTDSRHRVVAAQDAERKRLERDLHDGAQQALVAAIIGLRMVRASGLDRSEAITDLAELSQVLETARNTLLDLCGTSVPAVVAEAGLVGAVHGAAELSRRSGLDVRVHVDVPPALDSQVAAGVYFCCVEALQNIAKHARATNVRIDIQSGDGELRFAISDDGVGFSQSGALDSVGGVAKLAERVAVLGGSLVVESAPGRGTQIVGRVPCPGVCAVPSAAGEWVGAR